MTPEEAAQAPASTTNAPCDATRQGGYNACRTHGITYVSTNCPEEGK